ncbi:hypothetical protein WN55_11133 [Dufourea novaeangliae]|uniref:Uncharacterized protein n=1 Tax=Dufourea novaeangliae TaxID=178035 RepID=A0A154PDX9_DUFNO|nr:hypothetical protein WN55_11133 [Dufourea novaeangliae]
MWIDVWLGGVGWVWGLVAESAGGNSLYKFVKLTLVCFARVLPETIIRIKGREVRAF